MKCKCYRRRGPIVVGARERQEAQETSKEEAKQQPGPEEVEPDKQIELYSWQED